MKRWKAIAMSVIAAVAMVFSPAAAVAQGEAGPDNSAVAINTKDGADVFRLAFSIDRVMRDSVSPGNAAVAYSSCDSCTTTAIAIQVVFLMNDEQDVAPENLAMAVNEQCSSCTTVALAYQIVLYTDGPVVISAEGQRKIQAILAAIRALEGAGLSPEQLEAQTDALVNQLAKVLAEETRSARPPEVRKQTQVTASPPPASVAPTDQPPATSEPTSAPESSETPAASATTAPTAAP